MGDLSTGNNLPRLHTGPAMESRSFSGLWPPVVNEIQAGVIWKGELNGLYGDHESWMDGLTSTDGKPSGWAKGVAIMLNAKEISYSLSSEGMALSGVMTRDNTQGGSNRQLVSKFTASDSITKLGNVGPAPDFYYENNYLEMTVFFGKSAGGGGDFYNIYKIGSERFMLPSFYLYIERRRSGYNAGGTLNVVSRWIYTYDSPAPVAKDSFTFEGNTLRVEKTIDTGDSFDASLTLTVTEWWGPNEW